MRPVSIRCSWNIHKFTEVDEAGRVTCERCGARAKIKHKVIRDPALAGREMERPKTKPGKMLPVHKQKPFVRSGAKT